MFQLDPMELNNTRKAKREILFFNRVPKVGSQTTMELLKSLSLKNKFHYHKDKTQKVEVIKLNYSQEVSSSVPLLHILWKAISEMALTICKFP